MIRRLPSALLVFALALGLPLGARGEEEPPDNRFLISGYGFTSYVDPDAGDGSFGMGFVPIFLYRVSDQILFEAEVEFEYEDEALETALEYAQVDWIANDYLTVVAGKFLTPFGTFVERLHPAWINKLPTAPLPLTHGQSLVPFSQTGLQLRGGIPLGDGNRRLTYSVFASNGFRVSEHGHGGEESGGGHEEEALTAASRWGGTASSEDGDEHDEGAEPHEEEAELVFLDGSNFNGNGDLALGGRVGVVAAKGLELGASFLSGTYDELAQLDSETFGFDFAYHHDLFEIRGEWLDGTTELGLAEDGDALADQEIQSWYLQGSLRLSVIPVYAFNRLEMVARLASLDAGSADRDQTTIGLNYYFNGSTIVRLAWERMEETGHAADDSLQAMFAYGF